MLFSTSPSHQATTPSRKSVLGPHNLGQVIGKIWQKMMKLSKRSKEDPTIMENSAGAAEIHVARFVTFTRPTEAPQIIDLKAMRQNVSQKPAPRGVSRSQTEPNRHKSGLRTSSFKTTRSSSTEMRTPLLKDPQPVPSVLETTSDHRSAAAAAVGYEGYEMLDEGRDSDLDWTLLDLPGCVYGRLANESRHSLL